MGLDKYALDYPNAQNSTPEHGSKPMIKALFLDMDETLCDTHGADETAKQRLASDLTALIGKHFDSSSFANEYVQGIYRQWSEKQRLRYLPVAEQESEGAFRRLLVHDLLAKQGQIGHGDSFAQNILDKFDQHRMDAFDFYPGITDFLLNARKVFKLVVITNGPEHSQIPKTEKIKLADYVDHIIIGGQEPEQKPAVSIFEKALALVDCQPHEAIHVGDNLAADIAGANDSGITSVWIQHQQALDAELGINPDHTIIRPDEIPAIIRHIHPH